MDESLEKRDRCLKKFKDNNPISPRLTLRNMSSAFIVLLVGYVVALIVFVGERIVYRFTKKSVRQSVHSERITQPVVVPL